MLCSGLEGSFISSDGFSGRVLIPVKQRLGAVDAQDERLTVGLI